MTRRDLRVAETEWRASPQKARCMPKRTQKCTWLSILRGIFK